MATIQRLLDARFSAPEIEAAGRFLPRTMELLKREGLAPMSMTERGRGRMAMYDFPSFCRFVTIAALGSVMGSVIAAAKIATAVDELIEIYGQIPHGMKDISRKLAGAENILSHELLDDGGKLIPLAVMRAALQVPAIKLEKPWASDYVLVIVDSEFVLSKQRGGQETVSSLSKAAIPAEPELRYRYGGRGKDLEVFPFMGSYNLETERLYLDRLSNAVTLVEINLSVAVRRALLHVLAVREADVPKQRGPA